MWKTVKAIWHAVSAVSTASWLWGLPWAAGGAALSGVWAALAGLPPPVIGVLSLATAVIFYLFYVGFVVHRTQKLLAAAPGR